MDEMLEDEVFYGLDDDGESDGQRGGRRDGEVDIDRPRNALPELTLADFIKPHSGIAL